MRHQTKPKPSSLAQQIKQARREVWSWPKEKRESVQLQGSSEPLRGAVCIKNS